MQSRVSQRRQTACCGQKSIRRHGAPGLGKQSVLVFVVSLLEGGTKQWANEQYRCCATSRKRRTHNSSVEAAPFINIDERTANERLFGLPSPQLHVVCTYRYVLYCTALPVHPSVTAPHPPMTFCLRCSKESNALRLLCVARLFCYKLTLARTTSLYKAHQRLGNPTELPSFEQSHF